MTEAHTDTRPFGFWTATAMVIGGMIGAGVFVLPSQLAPYGWTGVAAWVLGGAAAVLIASVLAGVAAARPREPGLVAIIGEVLGPVAGCLVGWGGWVSYWCANAYIALVAARYGGQFAPALASSQPRQALVASLIIAGLTAINLASLKAAGRLQVVTTALKLLPMLAVLIIVIMLVLRGGGEYAAVAHPRLDPSQLFTATSLAFVAIVGFETASIAAQRVRDPERNIPRATLLGVVLTCLVYLVVCVGIDFALPVEVLTASNAPIALFVGQYWGPWAGGVIAAFAVISCIGCLNVWIMMQSEVPLGLVRAGLLPGWLGRTNRHDVATAPMLIASGLSVALLFVGSWQTGAGLMDFLLLLTSVSALWIYAFACVAALMIGTHRIAAVLGLLFCAGVLYGSGLETVLLSVALLLAALPLYALATRGGQPQAA